MSTEPKPVDPGTDLVVFVQSTALAQDMPALIKEYDERLANANAAFKNLPKITDEATKEVYFKFKELVNQRLKEFNEHRMPFTRDLNNIIKLFTTREKEWERLVLLTDDATSKWARQQLELSRAAQAEADAKLKAEQAKINLDGRIREYSRQRLSSLLDVVRGGAGSLVDKVTKANFEATKKRLQTEPKWTEDMAKFLYEVPTWITDHEHFKSIIAGEIEAITEEYLTESAEILKRSITILEAAVTNKADAQALKEAEEKRAKEEEARKAEEMQKDLAAQQALAEVDQEKVEAPKVRVKMKVDILDEEAWLQFFAFWWKNEKDKGVIERKTMQQIKNFVEKHGNSTGEFLTHPSIEWVEDVKAR